MPPSKAARAKASSKSPVKPVAKSAAKAAPKAVPKAVQEPLPMPRRALGRGLSSLIPPSAAVTSTGSGYRTLPIERLKPNKKQPRKHFDEGALSELTHSIRTQGILQPILVRKLGNDYEIVAGERRWRAATRAGLREVPTVVKELSDSHALQLALIENIQRSDLDPIEEAEAYYRLCNEHKLTHEELAEAVGKNRVTITNSLRLLKMPQAVLTLLMEGKLTASHVRPLMPLEDDKLMVRLAEEFAGRKVSVQQAKERVAQVMAQLKKTFKGRSGASKTTAGKSEGVRHLEEQLQSYLKTKVVLDFVGTSGEIRIKCPDLTVLDDVVEKIMTA